MERQPGEEAATRLRRGMDVVGGDCEEQPEVRPLAHLRGRLAGEAARDGDSPLLFRPRPGGGLLGARLARSLRCVGGASARADRERRGNRDRGEQYRGDGARQAETSILLRERERVVQVIEERLRRLRALERVQRLPLAIDADQARPRGLSHGARSRAASMSSRSSGRPVSRNRWISSRT
jgi:hypothetical protein